MAEASKNPVRVRMAPSPTGSFHIGSAHTALFNWLFARQHGGAFVLRIEDTDKERSEKRHEDDIIESLRWLGLQWDEGPYRQSERTEIYKGYLQKLLAKGDAYYCYCTRDELEAQRQVLLAQGLPPKYSGHCRQFGTPGAAPPAGRTSEVIRFKTPETKVEFKDLVRGKVRFDESLFGDIVLAKDLETPLYNFAVVVEDGTMKITHVIRGEDHLSNTPKQILFLRALGFTEPIYAHIPLILNSDRSKMSKRFSDTALAQYREKGYLPSAMVNFLAFLGWHPKGNHEVMSLEQLIKEFDLSRVQQAGAIFNQDKLDWLNREHMKLLSDTEIAALLRPMLKEKNIAVADDFLERLVRAERTRATTLADFITNSSLFFALPEYEVSLLIWKEAPKKEVTEILTQAGEALANIDEQHFDRETLVSHITAVIGARNRGEVLWPLRVALSGMSASPDPLDIMAVLGKKESLARIAIAVKKLG